MCSHRGHAANWTVHPFIAPVGKCCAEEPLDVGATGQRYRASIDDQCVEGVAFGCVVQETVVPAGIARTQINDGEGNSAFFIEDLLKAIESGIKYSWRDETVDWYEGPDSDYWRSTAANAIKPLYQLLALAKMRSDCIWDGD